MVQQVTLHLERADDAGVVEVELTGVAVDQFVEVVAEVLDLGGGEHCCEEDSFRMSNCPVELFPVGLVV